MKKLKDPDEPLQRLFERVIGLEEKLGPVLFQFPHTWPLNLARLERFLEALQPYASLQFAFEFRHRSWLQPPVFQLLERHSAALCLPVSPSVPLELRTTTDWTYIRVHSGRFGIGLDDEELGEWAARIREFQDRRLTTYVYFNNDPEGHALRDAERLKTKLLEFAVQ